MKNSKPFVLVIAGSSGVGKDSLAKELLKYGYRMTISLTTRPKRNYEVDGIDYHFVNLDTFLFFIVQDELIEYRRYDTLENGKSAVWYYGVPWYGVHGGIVNIIISDLEGTAKFKDLYGDDCLTLFLDATPETRRNRAIKRGSYDEGEFNRRLLDDEKRLSCVNVNEFFDVVLESSDIVSDATKVHNILREFTGE